MARITIGVGVLLIILGVGAYGLALAGAIGSPSLTALIPAAFGLVLAALGAVARAKPALNKHMMHVAVIIGLLGFLGSAPGIINLIRHATDSLPPDKPVRVAAWVAQMIMALVLAVYVGLCVKSFIDARKARGAEPVN